MHDNGQTQDMYNDNASVLWRLWPSSFQRFFDFIRVLEYGQFSYAIAFHTIVDELFCYRVPGLI